MANTISSWFIPFWYSAASGENTTLEMINKKFEELKTKNQEPSFLKTLTPAKATAGGVGILGILVAVIGFFKENTFGKVLGIGAAILAGVGWFIDKLLVKSSASVEQNKRTKEQKVDADEPRTEQKELTAKDFEKVKEEIKQEIETILDEKQTVECRAWNAERLVTHLYSRTTRDKEDKEKIGDVLYSLLIDEKTSAKVRKSIIHSMGQIPYPHGYTDSTIPVLNNVVRALEIIQSRGGDITDNAGRLIGLKEALERIKIGLRL